MMKNELKAILDDIVSGALSPCEYLPYLAYTFRTLAWGSIAVIFGFALAWLIYG